MKVTRCIILNFARLDLKNYHYCYCFRVAKELIDSSRKVKGIVILNINDTDQYVPRSYSPDLQCPNEAYGKMLHFLASLVIFHDFVDILPICFNISKKIFL